LLRESEGLEEEEGLSVPPTNIPDDPLDIKTPLAPPSLEVPEDAPPPTGESSEEPLSLPTQPLQVRVEAIRGYSLENVLKLALDRNPEIETARLAVESAQKGVRAARAPYFPQLSTDLGYSYSEPVSPEPESQSTGLEAFGFTQPEVDKSDISSQLNGSVQLSFTVFDGGNRIASLRIAQQELKIAELDLDETTERVRLDVAEAYFNLQLADAQVLVAESALEDSRASLKDAEAQERAGVGTRFEVLQAQTRVANNLRDLIARQNEQRIARFNLASLLNFERNTEVAATDPVQPTGQWDLSLEETIVAAFESRAEFQRRREELEQRRQEARQVLSSILPQAEVSASFDYGSSLRETDSQDSFFDTGYTLGGQLQWAFFDGGEAVARAQQADIAALQVEKDFQQVRNQVRLDVENAFLSLNSNREQIEAAKVALESAQEQLRLARLRFQAGVGTQTEVLDAESELSTARGNLADAITNYNLSIVRLKRSVSGL
jgi:OMF family outer membrane factor